MIKKSITYTNFNDEQVTEEHWFHLSKADLAEMEMSVQGGLHDHLTQIIKDENGNAIMQQFKDLIQRSYGQRSPDGKRFIKNSQLWEDFNSSEAYSELFMELVTDADKAAEFVNGIIPQGLDASVDQTQSRIDRIRAEAEASHPSDPAAQKPPRTWDETESAKQGEGELGVSAAGPRRLTKAEVASMDDAELKHLLATGQAVIGE